MNEENDEEIKDDSATEVFDFSKPDYEFKPKEYHEWRQRGPFLVCTGCELEHATYIGMEKILIGLKEDGTPILKNR
jgi:hypothetical protein